MSRVCTNALERKSLTVAKSGCSTIARGKRNLFLLSNRQSLHHWGMYEHGLNQGKWCDIYIYIFNVLRFAFFLQKQIDGSYVTIDVSTSGATYVVNTVDLKTKEVGEASDILHSTLQPAVVASSNRIIVCGGLSQQKIVNYCQVYSTQTNE